MPHDLMLNKVEKPILVLDFDGVCSTYEHGWEGATVINDPPTDGLFEFINAASKYFVIYVHSARSCQEGGIQAMSDWFNHRRDEWLSCGNSFDTPADIIIRFPYEKPAAFITIDDRGWRFDGQWPDPEVLRSLDRKSVV